MKPKRTKATVETCVYCDQPIDKGGIVVYPHPEWETKPGGRWLNGKRHPECRERKDNEPDTIR
jgi:hypothetical protein